MVLDLGQAECGAFGWINPVRIVEEIVDIFSTISILIEPL
jgi:hypothetical protein